MQSISFIALVLLAPEPQHTADLVFPPENAYRHAAGIVECPNGDLLVSWFASPGNRFDPAANVMGSRKAKGSDEWSEPFELGDTPNIPEGDTCMVIDSKKQLWLFYTTMTMTDEEPARVNFKVSMNFENPGPPEWYREGFVEITPDDFGEEAQENFQESLAEIMREISDAEQEAYQRKAARFTEVVYQRRSWQVHSKPVILPSGRLLLPLYSDSLNICIAAYTDDDGVTWNATHPILGYGAVQPSIVRRRDGGLVAFMRDNSLRLKIRISESEDDGMNWGPVTATDLINPNSALDAHRLANGHWILIHNDTTSHRNRLLVSLSTDEGQTWDGFRHLEDEPRGLYMFPSATQGADGTIHVVYSYFTMHPVRGNSIKHAAFNEAWIRAGNP